MNSSLRIFHIFFLFLPLGTAINRGPEEDLHPIRGKKDFRNSPQPASVAIEKSLL
jgi:hypothetical protein